MVAFVALLNTLFIGYILYCLVVAVGLVSGQVSIPFLVISILGTVGFIPVWSKKSS